MYTNMNYVVLIIIYVLITLRLKPIKSSILNRRSEWPCNPLIIPNAVVKYRRKNKLAKIRCNFGYGIMGGDRRLTCIRNKWKGKVPHCITIGCDDLTVSHGEAIKLYNGALIHFSCEPGYKLQGSPAVFCDGIRWNATAPTCTIPNQESHHRYCNYEFRRMCDWIQDHIDDFNWKLTTGVMNSVTGALGPKSDHTLKKSYGHYLYVDSNENWSSSKKARIFSPIIAVPAQAPSCVTFWYHMNGPTVGILKVYLKPETMPFEILSPRLALTGDHKDKWNRLVMHISDISDDFFQIVLEACGGDGYMADIAIDDFQVLAGTTCISLDIEQATSTEFITVNQSPAIENTTPTFITVEPITTEKFTTEKIFTTVTLVNAFSCRNRCGNDNNIPGWYCSCEVNNCLPAPCCADITSVCPNSEMCPIRRCCPNYHRMCSIEQYTSTTSQPIITREINTSPSTSNPVNITIPKSSIISVYPTTEYQPRTSTTRSTVHITTTDKASSITRQILSSTLKANLTINTEKSTPSTAQTLEQSSTTSKTSSVTPQEQFTDKSKTVSMNRTLISFSSSPETTISQTTITSYTESRTSSFEGAHKPSISAPILVSVLGMITITGIVTFYLIKRKHQSSLYNYSDIGSNSEKTPTEEEPVQKDTSNYVPLGDDSLVHIDYD